VNAKTALQHESTFRRYERLLAGVMRGALDGNLFEAWEVAIIADLAACRLESRRRTEILVQYRNAVARQLRSGAGPPMTLSDFLILRDARRESWGKR